MGKSFFFAFLIYTVVMNIGRGVGGIHTAKMANILFLSFAINDTQLIFIMHFFGTASLCLEHGGLFPTLISFPRAGDTSVMPSSVHSDGQEERHFYYVVIIQRRLHQTTPAMVLQLSGGEHCSPTGTRHRTASNSR